MKGVASIARFADIDATISMYIISLSGFGGVRRS